MRTGLRFHTPSSHGSPYSSAIVEASNTCSTRRIHPMEALNAHFDDLSKPYHRRTARSEGATGDSTWPSLTHSSDILILSDILQRRYEVCHCPANEGHLFPFTSSLTDAYFTKRRRDPYEVTPTKTKQCVTQLGTISWRSCMWISHVLLWQGNATLNALHARFLDILQSKLVKSFLYGQLLVIVSVTFPVNFISVIMGFWYPDNHPNECNILGVPTCLSNKKKELYYISFYFLSVRQIPSLSMIFCHLDNGVSILRS